MFVLRRTEDGKFVAAPGYKHSYTAFLQFALVFNTIEEANRHRCVENECVESVNDILSTHTLGRYQTNNGGGDYVKVLCVDSGIKGRSYTARDS